MMLDLCELVHTTNKPTSLFDTLPISIKHKMASGGNLLRTTLIPFLLMLISPPGILFVWVVCYHHEGSLKNALHTSPSSLLSQFPSPSREGAYQAISFLFLQLFLLIIVPGRIFVAEPTPMGNRPRYRLNGPLCFVMTHALLGVAHVKGVIRYAALYDNFGGVLSFLSQSALITTIILYFRGIYIPTGSDSGMSGYGFIWDLWHGTELHPEIFGVSLKQLINCRFAMMGWSVACVAFAMKQVELYGSIANSMIVSAGLQMVYIIKFFMWEGGYFNSVDIIHDRFGFYIFWGCTAFLPSIYTLTSYYLTTHPIHLSPLTAFTITLIGLSSVICNYWTDRQRQTFRSTNGQTLIFGRKPRIIHAEYVTGDGKTRESILLASGWWGMARHINYLFEVVLALSWSLPAGLGIIPYVYVIFLSILLIDRAYRDEVRCQLKYGEAYRLYCEFVPWKIVPGVY